jgi:hypothetical protein
MKWKTRLEIKLPERSDPFKQLTRLLNKGKVLRSYVASSDTLVVIYDNRKLTIPEILRITRGHCINEDHSELMKAEEALMQKRVQALKSNKTATL